ncbi:MAG: phosphate ABC transporter permease subunit PstC [Epulopiscium sp.]|nr:phosphate ABC transporter permease subunit PstC [Candidatus Epulonipiscium sp.]
MKVYEKVIQVILLICAMCAILGVGLITLFILKEGIPLIGEYGFFKFVGGTTWAPLRGEYGILPMIIGSVLTTIGALMIGVPIGIGCAIYLAEIATSHVVKLMNPIIELLAGIPSVIYGLYGLTVIVPWIRKAFNNQGFSILAGSIILAIMVLPTIINISQNAIKSVPGEYKEGAVALGSSHWQAIVTVIIPAARSGIIAAIVLALGRAIGETMAIIMVIGNTPVLPKSILEPARTLTGNIGIEMGYASFEHQEALFATGIILFVFIMVLNIGVNMIPKRIGEK